MTSLDSQRPVRILVVDDSDVDRLAVRRCLQQAGIDARVDEAGHAAEALERVRPGAYDCVLLDFYLPGTDAAALLRDLQTLAPDIPIVIFTGRGDEEIAVEFMKSGAADYLPKSSLTPERLATSFRYAVEKARASQARRSVEQALREREAEFRTLANVIPQLTWIADSEGRGYWFNDRWYEFTGLRPDESLGLGWRLAHHPDHRTRVSDSQLEAFTRGESWEDTFPLKRRDGTYRWFLSRAVPIRADDGSVARWFGTNTDITERLEADTERERVLAVEREARAVAERATHARDEVLAIVAHDLRNPMQTVMAAAAMIALAADEDKRLRHISIIQRSTQEMARLITDLLDVARIESGTFTIRREPVDLTSLLDEAIEMFDPQARASRIVLERRVEDGVPPIAADRDRLMQVLSNLLGNSLKFTPADRTVSVSAVASGGSVQISVKDSGPGIPEDELPHVFDRFWQASRQSRAGAGLGLAICKGIIEAHDGRIWAASKEGRGTTIHFTLPREAGPADEAR